MALGAGSLADGCGGCHQCRGICSPKSTKTFLSFLRKGKAKARRLGRSVRMNVAPRKQTTVRVKHLHPSQLTGPATGYGKPTPEKRLLRKGKCTPSGPRHERCHKGYVPRGLLADGKASPARLRLALKEEASSTSLHNFVCSKPLQKKTTRRLLNKTLAMSNLFRDKRNNEAGLNLEGNAG